MNALAKLALMALGFAGGVFAQWKLDKKDRVDAFERVERAEAQESAAKASFEDRDQDAKGWRRMAEQDEAVIARCVEDVQECRGHLEVCTETRGGGK